MTTTAMLTTVIEQALTDVLPNCVRTIQTYCVGPCDLNCATASDAVNAQNLARDFVEAKLLDRQARSAGRTRIV
jgi:hypothetical protein